MQHGRDHATGKGGSRDDRHLFPVKSLSVNGYPVQTVDGGQRQPAQLQRSSGRSDGVCEGNEQAEYPWSARQTAPNVTVIWGWGSCGLMVDLGTAPLGGIN